MTKRDAQDPAFPEPWKNDSDINLQAPDGQLVPPGYTIHMRGMTLRDYFAAAALQGYLASHVGENVKTPKAAHAAREAYAFADAMIEARGS